MPRNPDKIDYSGGLPESFEAFDVVEDPRHPEALGKSSISKVTSSPSMSWEPTPILPTSSWTKKRTISQDHEKAHGRQTTRIVLATSNLSALDPEIRGRCPEPKSLIVVETDTTVITTGKPAKKKDDIF